MMQDVLSTLDRFTGVKMSTRQVYYQLVSSHGLENVEKSADKVQRLIVNMRRSGHIPSDRIVDRNQVRHQLAGWDGAEEIVSEAHKQYRRNIWSNQPTVVMVGLEKAALEGVFAEAVDAYGAQLWTLRGFNSESFAFEWATEIRAHVADGKRVAIRYFGDFDPSGLAIEKDMRVVSGASAPTSTGSVGACFGATSIGSGSSAFRSSTPTHGPRSTSRRSATAPPSLMLCRRTRCSAEYASASPSTSTIACGSACG